MWSKLQRRRARRRTEREIRECAERRWAGVLASLNDVNEDELPLADSDEIFEWIMGLRTDVRDLPAE
jgi:hypothetical protein